VVGHGNGERSSGAVRPGGRLAFACWQEWDRNPWLADPYAIGLSLLPVDQHPPPADPFAPGPFAFADRDRTASLLADAGWIDIEIVGQEVDYVLTTDGLADGAWFLANFGALATLLKTVSAEQRTGIEAAVERFAAERLDDDGRIVMPGAIWVVTACRPG
jgi:hypothetical protein